MEAERSRLLREAGSVGLLDHGELAWREARLATASNGPFGVPWTDSRTGLEGLSSDCGT
jgi:hypothetical protein